MLRGDKRGADEDKSDDAALIDGSPIDGGDITPVNPAVPPADTTRLSEQVALARQLAVEQPDRAVIALQRMLVARQDGT